MTDPDNHNFCFLCVVKSQFLPMKRLRSAKDSNEMLGNRGGGWANQLWNFAVAFAPVAEGRDDPIQGLTQLLDNSKFKALLSFEEEMVEVLPAAGRGIASLAPTEVAMNDHLINAVCRAAYLPAEYLLRQYQPYPMCLLIIPVYRFHVPWIKDQSTSSCPAGFGVLYGDWQPGEARIQRQV